MKFDDLVMSVTIQNRDEYLSGKGGIIASIELKGTPELIDEVYLMNYNVPQVEQKLGVTAQEMISRAIKEYKKTRNL